MRLRALALGLAALACGSQNTTSMGGSAGAVGAPSADAGTSAPPADGASSNGPAADAADAGPPAPIRRHTLTISSGNFGSVQGRDIDCWGRCVQTFDEGAIVRLVAVPERGSGISQFQFGGWNGDCSGTGDCVLAMSVDRSVSTTFSWVAALTIARAGSGTGRVTSSPSGIDCPGTCITSVEICGSVTLTATADAGSTFAGWGGACKGTGSVCRVRTCGNHTLWANFEAAGPPLVSACAGIAPPDAPPAVQFVQYPGYESGFSCGNAAADSSGMLALVLNGWHADGILFVNPSGTPVGESSASMDGIELQQPSGFAHLSGRPYLGPEWAIQHGQMIADFDSSGSATGHAYFANYSGQPLLAAAANPNGGVLLAGDLGSAPPGAKLHAAVMYQGGGGKGQVSWGPAGLASSGTVLGVGVDTRGKSLIITDGMRGFGDGAISAQWFDEHGTAITYEFLLLSDFVPGASTWFETSPLIGGGLVVSRMDGPSHSQAVAIVDNPIAVVRAPPPWMRARRDAKLQIARGGTAYAVLPLGASAVPCTQRVELIAPDGTSCATADYPIAGGICDTRELRLGVDGTIIQQLPAAMEQTNVFGGNTCTWRWWPAALR
jgi:hypothetical protein